MKKTIVLVITLRAKEVITLREIDPNSPPEASTITNDKIII